MRTGLPKLGIFDLKRSMEEDMCVWICPHCKEEMILEYDCEGSVECENCGQLFRVVDACCIDLEIF